MERGAGKWGAGSGEWGANRLIIEAGLGDRWWADYGEPIDGNRGAMNRSGRLNVPSAGPDGVAQQRFSPPVMLHSREVVVVTPRQVDPTRVVAPVPRYMAATMAALGWDAALRK